MILEPAVTKQTVGIHFLLNRLLFVRHILRKLRARFSSLNFDQLIDREPA